VDRLIGVFTDAEGAERLAAGECPVYLNGERPVKRQLRTTRNDGCDMIMVEDIGMSIPLAMPIVVKIRTTLNYWMSKLNEEALFERLYEKYNDINQCYDVNSANSSDEMTPDDFIGIFILLGAACFIAVIIRVGGFIRDKEERQRFSTTFNAILSNKRLDPTEEGEEDLDAAEDVTKHPTHLCEQLEHSLHEMKEMHKGLRERTKASISEFQRQQDEILNEVRALQMSLSKTDL
jgi:hypothetical protein